MSRATASFAQPLSRGALPSRISKELRVAVPHASPSRRTLAARHLCRAESSATDVYRWPEWSETWRFLTDKGLTSVSAERAQEMVASGQWTLVDVRPSSLYESAHAEGAISVPLFDNFGWSGASPMAYVRAVAYMVNGVAPVVPNETFSEEIAKAKEAGKGFIFYCETGGTMQPSTNFMFGKESRSLKACYRALQKDGELAAAHLEGGLFAWYNSQLPMIGDYDTGNAGRTPNIAENPDLEKNQ